ncbi:MAG: helix-turn-helix domain-containing protein [Opitutaceae bacterium]|nr:helix-turn-helix domain-containing protein [Opitutaceae bacterium]
MNAFDQLAAVPGLRRLFDLAWRMFGVNPALVSMDGRRFVIFDKEERAQPFCRALNRLAAGRQLCAMCDQNRFLEARRDRQALRYRCHAGLREFIIPVIRDGQTIALLQCGQVHDRVPAAPEWREARRSLVAAGIGAPALRPLFDRNRVLEPDRQGDLLDLLALIAARLAQAHEHALTAAPGQAQAALGRAMTYIDAQLGERLTVAGVARAANLSPRSLMRLFRKEAGTTVVEFILRRRIARARQLLRQPDRTCAETAFACGFGSVQHFNRIFRRLEQQSPTEWRRRGG